MLARNLRSPRRRETVSSARLTCQLLRRHALKPAVVSLLLGVLVVLPLSSLELTEPMGLWGFFNGADEDGVGVQAATLPKEPRIEPRLDGAVATPSAPKLVTCATSEAAAKRAPPRVRPVGDPLDSRIPPRFLVALLLRFPDSGRGVPLPGDVPAPPG